MIADFNTIIDRRNTNCLKHDFAARRGKPEDALPLWIADMDFPAPQCARDALQRLVKHGVFGYGDTGAPYFEAVRAWLASRHGYNVRPEWLVKTPGVVFAVAAAVRALTRKGDAVLVQPPVYNPFFSCIRDNGRALVVNELVYRDGKYAIDFEDFERAITENAVKLFILCSPHNPVGRVWTVDELTRMGGICQKHGVIVLSDEIHMDFVYPGRTHMPFASLSPAFEGMSLTLTSPSKTFNIAGLQIANIFIADERLRALFRAEIERTGYAQPNIMGIAACEAAYRDGAPWLDTLLAYLEDNMACVRDYLNAHIPQIRLVEPEGTYLAWLDCRSLGLDEARLDALMEHKAKLWLVSGPQFGRGGEGFQRVNIACPRGVLEDAMRRMARAVGSLQFE